MENTERTGNRIDYYTGLAKEYYSQYSSNFEDFVDDKEVISFGDGILIEGLSTGFNFVYKYPMPNDFGTILYSVYSQRYRHFGKVLAKMENLEIIDESSFKFFVKGTKIIGDYTDPELQESSLQSGDGKIIKCLESVEGTIAFYPKDEIQAIEIVAFLMREAPQIDGGYLDPDVRASYDFEKLIGGIGLKKVMANVLKLENGSYIFLRQKSRIELPGWMHNKTMVNQELYQFLASELVKP